MAGAELREEITDLRDQIRSYEDKVTDYESGDLLQKEEERTALISQLQEKVALLEEQLQEKNQTIKVQSQRIVDMKKTMQRELRLSPDCGNKRVPRNSSPNRNSDNGRPANNSFSSTSPAVLSLGGAGPPMDTTRLLEVPAITKDGPVDPINLEYLKHVVLKFVTSREYEVSISAVYDSYVYFSIYTIKFM